MRTRVFVGGEVRRILQRPIVGRGGFQSLLRLLRSRLNGNVMSLGTDDLDRINNYARLYGDGGFQGRLLKLLGVVK